jgi:hypothetical protein
VAALVATVIVISVFLQPLFDVVDDVTALLFV